MKIVRFVFVLLLLTAAASALAKAKVKVEQDPAADFSKLGTYSWTDGTDTRRPDIQEWIVTAIESELEGKGLTKVEQGEGDIKIASHAFLMMDGAMRGNYMSVDTWAVGIITSDVIDISIGTLLIEVHEASSGKVVWRGSVSEDFKYGIQDYKIKSKVDRMTKKVFKSYPKRR